MPRQNFPDVIDMLTEDHDKVSRMFADFRKMLDVGGSNDEARQMLVESACTELAIHAQVEEELFYPAVRAALDDRELLDEAAVEHMVARQLITDLESMLPGDESYDAKFIVLGEYVMHHIEQERSRIFARIRKSGIDLETLGHDVHARREELRIEFGLPEEEYRGPDRRRNERALMNGR